MKIYDDNKTPVEALAADTAKLKACTCADCAVATELQALEAECDRLLKFQAEATRCRELLTRLVAATCSRRDGGLVDSDLAEPLSRPGISEAMRYLLDVGRLEVVNVIGQRLIGRWK